MYDYSKFTLNDFLDRSSYELYGFIGDIRISNDKCSEMILAAFDRAEQLSCTDIYKENADSSLKKRTLMREWLVADREELLSDDIYKRLFSLTPLEQPYVQCLLREQAEMLRCKTEFNKKLAAAEALMKYSEKKNIPEDFPFIFPKRINSMSGQWEYGVNPAMLAEYWIGHTHHRFIGGRGEEPRRYIYDEKKWVYKISGKREIMGSLDELVRKFDRSMVESRISKEAFTIIDNMVKHCSPESCCEDENIINFENGLLRLDTLELMPHTPEIFTSNQIPCRWTGEDSPSPVTDRFMSKLTDGNKETEEFLYAYIGLILSNIKYSRFKKAVFMVGAPNTGKSQLVSLVSRIIGSENCASISLSALEERFGVSVIYGKRLACCADLSSGRLTDTSIFKQITGGDAVMVEYKGQGAFSAVFNGFLWFCSNDMPHMGRDGQDKKAVYSRLAIIPCNNVIPPTKRDRTLTDKLYSERSAIIYRAVLAAKRVADSGYTLPVPQCSVDKLKEYMDENSTVRMFLKECCQKRRPDTRGSSKGQIHKVYHAWCKQNGYRYPVTAMNFKKELCSFLNIPPNEIERIIKGNRYYSDIELTSEAIREFSEAYGYDRI